MQDSGLQASGFTEKSLQHLIPGYNGYLNAKEAAADDSRIRAHIAASIGEAAAAVEVRKRAYASSIQTVSSLAALERVTSSLKLVAETIRYSGETMPVFDDSSPWMEKCSKLKAYDEFLYFSLQEMKNIVAGLESASGASAIEGVAGAVEAWAEKYLAQIKARKNIT